MQTISTSQASTQEIDLSGASLSSGSTSKHFEELKPLLVELLSSETSREALINNVLHSNKDSALRAKLIGDLDSCVALAFLVGSVSDGQLKLPKQFKTVQSTLTLSLLRGVDVSTDEPARLLTILSNYGGKFEHLKLFADKFLAGGKNIFKEIPNLKVRVIKSEGKDEKIHGRVKGDTGRLLKGRVFQIYNPLDATSAGFLNGGILTCRLLLSFQNSHEIAQKADQELNSEDSLRSALTIGDRLVTPKARTTIAKSGEVTSLEKYREALEKEVLRLKELVDTFPVSITGSSDSTLSKGVPCIRLVTQGRGAIWRWFSERHAAGLLPEAIEHAYVNLKLAPQLLSDSDRDLFRAALFSHYQQNVTVSSKLITPLLRDLELLIDNTGDNNRLGTLKAQQTQLNKLIEQGEISLAQYASAMGSVASTTFRASENRDLYNKFASELGEIPKEITELFLDLTEGQAARLKEDSFGDSLPLARIRSTRLGEKIKRHDSRNEEDRYAVLSDSELRAVKDLLTLKALCTSSVTKTDEKFFNTLDISTFRQMTLGVVTAVRKFREFSEHPKDPVLRMMIGSQALDLLPIEEYEALCAPNFKLKFKEILPVIQGTFFSIGFTPNRPQTNAIVRSLSNGLVPDLINRKGLQSYPTTASDGRSYLKKLEGYLSIDATLKLPNDTTISLADAIKEINKALTDSVGKLEVRIAPYDALFGGKLPNVGTIYYKGEQITTSDLTPEQRSQVHLPKEIAAEILAILVKIREINAQDPIQDSTGIHPDIVQQSQGFLILQRGEPPRYGTTSFGELRVSCADRFDIANHKGRQTQVVSLSGAKAKAKLAELEQLKLITLTPTSDITATHGISVTDWHKKHAEVAKEFQANRQLAQRYGLSIIEPAATLRLSSIGKVCVPESYFNFIRDYNAAEKDALPILSQISYFRYDHTTKSVSVARGDNSGTTIEQLITTTKGTNLLKFLAGLTQRKPDRLRDADKELATKALEFKEANQAIGFIDWLKSNKA